MSEDKGQGRVTFEDLHVAAEWLDINEGEFGEMESCQRVMKMLLREADRRLIAIGKRAVRK